MKTANGNNKPRMGRPGLREGGIQGRFFFGLALAVLLIGASALVFSMRQGEASASPQLVEVTASDTGHYQESDWQGSQIAPPSVAYGAPALDADVDDGDDGDDDEGSPGLPGGSGTLWVTDRGLNNVTAFDSGTGDVIGTVSVGLRPIGVTAPPGTRKVYVTNEDADTVSVIDKATLSVVKTVVTGDRPHHMTHSPNGKFVYVAEFNTNTVGVIDTKSDTVIAHYVAGTAAARTHAVWVTRDGKKLYVTNSVENTIAALDARTGALLWSLPVGNNPSEILVTPNGKTGYVTVRNENKVKIIDLTVPEIVGEVVVGTGPDTLQLTPNRKTLVVALRGIPAVVALVDTSTLAVTPVAIPGGTTTGHQWLSANGRYTFVAVEGPGSAGSVAVIRNSTASVVTMYPYPNPGAGVSRPHGVFHEPSDDDD